MKMPSSLITLEYRYSRSKALFFVMWKPTKMFPRLRQTCNKIALWIHPSFSVSQFRDLTLEVPQFVFAATTGTKSKVAPLPHPVFSGQLRKSLLDLKRFTNTTVPLSANLLKRCSTLVAQNWFPRLRHTQRKIGFHAFVKRTAHPFPEPRSTWTSRWKFHARHGLVEQFSFGCAAQKFTLWKCGRHCSWEGRCLNDPWNILLFSKEPCLFQSVFVLV